MQLLIVIPPKNGLLYFGQEQVKQQALQPIRAPKPHSHLSRPTPSAYSPVREVELLATLLVQMVSQFNTYMSAEVH